MTLITDRLDYPQPMSTSPMPARALGFASIVRWQRIAFTVCLSLAFGLLLGLGWTSSLPSLLLRTVALGLSAMLAFGLFEQWPRRLPAWFARWVLQVLAVAVAIPCATFVIYRLSTDAGAPPFWQDKERLAGFAMLSIVGVLVAPWAALAALLRQKEAIVRDQALAFALERSELERQAVDARLRLLQRQVEPHFLFNTLANVRELVESGSSQAATLLGSLIAYLRAAVPRLHDAATTLAQELQLVRAYLELMRMRMPDRLQFAIDAAGAALDVRCPPLILLTLVENAVRHGIDPSEDGGRIDVRVRVVNGRCHAEVSDSGIGLCESQQGTGTGLATLRERLQLTFAGDATVRLVALEPRGLRAELDFPARAQAGVARQS